MYRSYNKKSWDHVASWYKNLVDVKGMYYHKQIIIPNVLRLLDLNNDAELVDLACGEGVFSRYVYNRVKKYLGLDISSKLISYANKLNKYPNVSFKILDLTQKITLTEKFSHAVCILAIQNIKNIDVFFQNASCLLKTDGIFILVMNHPCFRIPRLTSWGIDESKRLQYRRVDRYMSPLNIPINVKPSNSNNHRYITWTYHYPLSYYVNSLSMAGFVVKLMEEWTSDKKSVGKHAKMENLARSEIPMFLAMKLIKIV